MTHILGFERAICSAEYGVGGVEYACPCDDGILDYGFIAQRVSSNEPATNPISIGWLPLYPTPHLATHLSLIYQSYGDHDG